ncbi:MAG: class I SAM-dependent methyltransferase [Natronomonas sp.]|uniref:class I SAM-dependent methyltransferase n=1 Tax=Natronomonas sp. TaxID=2184060 RepID=UPI00287034DF|nr:class I SAM-dependent methyltransferase [Natronomonas sp.]MDR9431806.1 class I SAM-dependent methyltransferase [Natronomonas sp.]
MSEDTSTAWDQIYATQGRRAEYPDEFVIRFVNKHLLGDGKDPASTRVLDLGCGPGRHVAYLAREGFETYGVDHSKVAVEMALDLCQGAGLDATVREEGITDLSFRDASFDCVIDCATIQHNYMDEIEAAVSEVQRVLKPDGLFFWKARAREDSFVGEGSEREPGTWVYHQESIVTEDAGDRVEKPTHFFTVEEITALLSEGFRDVDVEYTERTFDDMNARIAHYVVVARK